MESLWIRLQEMLQGMFARFADQGGALLPKIAPAIGVIIAGWILAAIASFLTSRILNFFAVDKLAAKTPLDPFLRELHVRRGPSQILGFFVFWLIVLTTLYVAAEMLDLTQISNAILVITLYVPRVIAAFLVIVAGMLLSKFLQVTVRQALDRSEFRHGRLIGKGVQFPILVFVFLAAAEQLGLDLGLITTNVTVVLFSVITVAGLGLVLASRHFLENIVACSQLRQNLKIGQRIEVADTAGVIKAITPTSVVVEQDGRDVLLPASLLYNQKVTIERP